MEIFIYKLLDYSFYISVIDKLSISVHFHNEIIHSEEISNDFSIKKLNIRILKFLMTSLSHYDLQQNKEGEIKLQNLAKYASLLVNLNYEISTELLIRIFCLLSEVRKSFYKIFIRYENELYPTYAELLIIKTILGKIIDNRAIG